MDCVQQPNETHTNPRDGDVRHSNCEATRPRSKSIIREEATPDPISNARVESVAPQSGEVVASMEPQVLAGVADAALGTDKESDAVLRHGRPGEISLQALWEDGEGDTAPVRDLSSDNAARVPVVREEAANGALNMCPADKPEVKMETCRVVWVGSFALSDISKVDIHNFFVDCGDIDQVEFGANCAHVHFQKPEAATAALAKSGGTLGKHVVKVELSRVDASMQRDLADQPSQTAPAGNSIGSALVPAASGEEAASSRSEGSLKIWIGGIPEEATEAELEELLNECGPIRNLKKGRSERGGNQWYAHAIFKNAEGAERAVKRDGCTLAGKPLKIGYAKEKGRDGRRGGRNMIPPPPPPPLSQGGLVPPGMPMQAWDPTGAMAAWARAPRRPAAGEGPHSRARPWGPEEAAAAAAAFTGGYPSAGAAFSPWCAPRRPPGHMVGYPHPAAAAAAAAAWGGYNSVQDARAMVAGMPEAYGRPNTPTVWPAQDWPAVRPQELSYMGFMQRQLAQRQGTDASSSACPCGVAGSGRIGQAPGSSASVSYSSYSEGSRSSYSPSRSPSPQTGPSRQGCSMSQPVPPAEMLCPRSSGASSSSSCSSLEGGDAGAPAAASACLTPRSLQPRHCK